MSLYTLLAAWPILTEDSALLGSRPSRSLAAQRRAGVGKMLRIAAPLSFTPDTYKRLSSSPKHTGFGAESCATNTHEYLHRATLDLDHTFSATRAGHSRMHREGSDLMLRVASIVASVALFGAVPAQAQSPTCTERTELVQHLAATYQEVPIAVGLADNCLVPELFASTDGEAWTAAITAPNGISCLVATGQYWYQLPRLVGFERPA